MTFTGTHKLQNMRGLFCVVEPSRAIHAIHGAPPSGRLCGRSKSLPAILWTEGYASIALGFKNVSHP